MEQTITTMAESSGNISLTDCQVNVYCKACKVPILHESVRCPKCFKCFHKSCVNTEVLAKNGGFSRCCGPGRKTSNTGGTFQFSLEDIRQTFRDEITPLARRIDNVEIRLDNIDTYLKDFSAEGLEKHSAIVQLNQRVDSIVSSGAGAPSTSGMTSDVFKEFDDRLRRQSNLMVFGLPEEDSQGSEDGKLQTKISDFFFLILNKSANDYNFKCMRMGRFLVNSTNPRPIKVIFGSPDSADAILQAFIKSKAQKNLPASLQHLTIARDQTPVQRREYLALKEEMRRRSQAGEKNLRIVTRGTHQTIVHSARTAVQSQNKAQ